MQYVNYNALQIGLNNFANKLDELDDKIKKAEEKYGYNSEERNNFQYMRGVAFDVLSALGGKYEYYETVGKYQVFLAGLESTNPSEKQNDTFGWTL